MMKDCPAWVAWVTLIAGILYLLADLGIFEWWGTFNWYTIAFLLIGLCYVTKK